MKIFIILAILSLLVLTFTVFITLKFAGVISWPWYFVLSPVFILISIALFFGLFLLFASLFITVP